MKSNLVILRTILSYNPITNIIGLVLYSLVAIVLIYSIASDKTEEVHGTVYFMLVMSASMIFVFNFSEKLGQLSKASFNHLLPNFNQKLIINILLVHLVLTGIPSILGYMAGLATVKLYLATNAIAFSVLVLNVFSVLLGSIWFAITILSLATEVSKIKKIDGYQAYQYLPIGQESLIAILIIFSIGLLLTVSSRPKNKQVKSKKCSTEEISVRYKKFELMNIIDRYWIVLKFKIYNALGMLKNRVEVALLSGQYQIITIFRFIIGVLVVMSLLNEDIKSFLLALQDGWAGDRNPSSNLSYNFIINTSIVWLSILASFDHSILTRFRFAQRYLWLKEPISGFKQFKLNYSSVLIKKIFIEIIATGTIWALMVFSFSTNTSTVLFLMLSFASFKAFSLLMGFWSLDRSHMKLVYFLAALFYVIYFAGWIFIALVLPLYGVAILSISIIIFAGLITRVYQRFMREQIING
ncbi:MAG: hypothetical protein HWE27_07065 [Gammaproteobacteria bacterium]|nr:hypothetical protein [Gammaproteobacteria bacterium]